MCNFKNNSVKSQGKIFKSLSTLALQGQALGQYYIKDKKILENKKSLANILIDQN